MQTSRALETKTHGSAIKKIQDFQSARNITLDLDWKKLRDKGRK